MQSKAKTLTAQLWDLLDDATERFMGIPKDERTTPEALKAAGEARGLSNALAVMVQPYLEDGTAVAKVAIKRMKARQAGEEMPPTHGYMSAEEARADVSMRHELSRAEAKTKARGTQAAKGEAILPRASGELTEDEKVKLAELGPSKVGQIQNGIRLDFGNQKLSDLYGVSLNIIVAIERELHGK